MVQLSFTFVNLTGNPATNQEKEEDMPTIRSHAMREVRRRKGLAWGTSAKSTTAALRSSTKVDHSDLSRSSRQVSQFPKMSYSRTFANPYSATPIEFHRLPADVPWQLHYFVHGFTPLTFPTSHVRHQCDILRVAMSEGNPAVLHALCAVSTMHRLLVSETSIVSSDALFPSESSIEIRKAFLFHKQCAITSLQINLSKSDDVQLQSSLATTALLLMMESLSGNATAATSTHRAGLLWLMKRHNQKQESSPVMTGDLLMSDIKSATSSLSRPVTKPCDDWLSKFDELTLLPFVPHRTDLVLLGNGFMTAKIGQYLGPDLNLLMCAMRNLINTVEEAFDNGKHASDLTGIYFLVLEHQLLTCQREDDGNGAMGSDIAECCRIASLLYCNLCLWSWPKDATLVHNLLSHLRTAILRWTPERYSYEQASVQLWLYFMGSFATSDLQERQWYLTGMKKVTKWFDIGDEDEFRSVLAGLFYVDRLMGHHLRDCYADIVRES